MWKKLVNFALDFFYPRVCFGCKKEGSYLCPDCKSTLDILEIHQKYQTQYIEDLYFALPYRQSLIKNLIRKFKYSPFVKELSEPLSSLIIAHLQLLDNKPDFSNFVIIPLPLSKKRLRWRGFNQAEEIAKHLSKFLGIPLLSNALLKRKNTLPQVGLSLQQRRQNIKDVFFCKEPELIKGKNIILVDDLYTTGATLNEAAKTLKESGAKKIIGMVVARADSD